MNDEEFANALSLLVDSSPLAPEQKARHLGFMFLVAVFHSVGGMGGGNRPFELLAEIVEAIARAPLEDE